MYGKWEVSHGAQKVFQPLLWTTNHTTYVFCQNRGQVGSRPFFVDDVHPTPIAEKRGLVSGFDPLPLKAKTVADWRVINTQSTYIMISSF